MLNIIFGYLMIISLFLLFRIIKGPTIWDRILGFNLFTAVIILLILVYTVIEDISYLIDIAIVYTLLGFIGIIFISRFVQRKGKI
jgi:multicomponent Na+:H+ antiporter subunit F